MIRLPDIPKTTFFQKTVFCGMVLFCTFAYKSGIQAQISTQKQQLSENGIRIQNQERQSQQLAFRLAKEKNWITDLELPDGGRLLLTGMTPNGLPEYKITDSNLGAANTTGASQLWPGGTLGINLDGSSSHLTGKLAIWDGGLVRSTHVELNTRIFAGETGSLSTHGTHVAGTMIAKGLNANAKGMAYNIKRLTSYNFSNDISEMSNAAPGLLISNHSYGALAGWRQSGSTWEYWGEWNSKEDYKFGFYDQVAQEWDNISYLAPNYLIVKSAGNNRNQNGPATGASYKRFNESGLMTDAPGPYVDTISKNNSYGTIPAYGNAKNILTVGAVSILNGGYTNASSVSIASFSSWGPTDDGRIKPDVVAAGVNIFSTTSDSNESYGTSSGTSMAAPNAAGSLILLQELYKNQTGAYLRSATLKGLAIHTAGEAGLNPGPDYRFGWGLLNVRAAAEVIMNRNTSNQIIEGVLSQNQPFTLQIIADGTRPLVATICWTDPSGISNFNNRLNDPTPKLIHDLDLRIEGPEGTAFPWKLTPNVPAAAAIKGDNNLDNVEKIEIPNPVAGAVYEIRITNKGVLTGNTQAFSLIVSGKTENAATGIRPLQTIIESLQIGPIPSKDFVYIKGRAKTTETLLLQVVDQTGRMIHFERFSTTKNQNFVQPLTTNKWSAGMYVIRLTVKNGQQVFKFTRLQ